ncbi:MAG: DUF502 domain-containing protein [Verrucomicrobia bacterium]|nr:DUF502 domain-containing protein [Verrucomicrobiota bacterium]
MSNRSIVRWRINFFAGLAVVLPVVVSLAIVVWLFATVSGITDTLLWLFFLPREWTHQNQGLGPVHWYWSLVALLVAVLFISLLGRFARHYVGKKLIQLVDIIMLRVPLLNKIYGTIKQVNEAFSSNKRSSFKQVVLVEFPRPGQYSVGFVTGEQNQEVQAKTKEHVVSVFIPTTPNPTTGFLILVPQHALTMLEMSVAEGIKFIISLGSVAPEYNPQLPHVAQLPSLPAVTTNSSNAPAELVALPR